MLRILVYDETMIFIRIVMKKINFSIKIDLWCLDGPQMIPGSKKNPKKKLTNSYKSHCFVINHHFEHIFDYETYLKLKISKAALDCLNITSVSLLGCPFVPKQGPWSLVLGPRSKVLGPRSLIRSLILDPWSLIRSLILDGKPLLRGCRSSLVRPQPPRIGEKNCNGGKK